MSFAHPLARGLALAGLALLSAAPSAVRAQTRQGTSSAAADVFRRYADRVVTVQVTETGSGFVVTAQGHVVTNYHVVSELLRAPERYRAELIDQHGGARPARVLAIDVVHDLAVLGGGAPTASFFTIAAAPVEQGERLYSLGNPHDLGLSIVEGTYNGNLEHTLYPKLHFTGAINPGMSGGPTITEDGRVVGINVSTSGDEVSFLVPAARAESLLARVRAAGGGSRTPTLADVGAQLRANQDAYLRDMFTGATETVALGPYRVVTQPAPFFRCWGDADRQEGRPFERVTHRCSTEDYVFIAGEQMSGIVTLKHELLTTRTLNPARFYALYSAALARDETPPGDEDHVTSWRCAARNVREPRPGTSEMRMRAVLCLRRYRKLGPLYDGVLRVAVLGRADAGLVSTLTLSGVTFENVERLTNRYLERVAWR